jgi:hypothetical protein
VRNGGEIFWAEATRGKDASRSGSKLQIKASKRKVESGQPSEWGEASTGAGTDDRGTGNGLSGVEGGSACRKNNQELGIPTLVMGEAAKLPAE